MNIKKLDLRSKKIELILIEMILCLLILYYQVGYIVLHDAAILKYLRDLCLAVLVAHIVLTRKKLNWMAVLSFPVCLGVLILWASLRTGSLSTSMVFARRYLFPVVFFSALVGMEPLSTEEYRTILRHFLIFLAVISAWGIFQAHVLGPSFLMDLGYPTKYSHAKSTITLKDSFYFGNLGIQRVTATLSNSNLFALILGTAIIAFLTGGQTLLKKKGNWILLLIVAAAYLLTFSRANFLAMLVVLMILWRYIPQKKVFLILALAGIGVFGLVYLTEDSSGIAHKLIGWVIRSLTMKEESAGARTGIWKTALDAVLRNPLGIGFGKTGSYAQTAGAEVFYHCENSFLAMALDFGIWGPFVYIGAFVFGMKPFWNGIRQNPAMCTAAIGIWVYLMICMMFSNHIYDMEAMTSVYFLLGIMLQQVNLEKNTRKEKK